MMIDSQYSCSAAQAAQWLSAAFLIALAAVGCENREHKTLGPEEFAWIPYDDGEVAYFSNGADTLRVVAGEALVFLDNEKKNTEDTYETSDFAATARLGEAESSAWPATFNFGWCVHLDARQRYAEQVFLSFFNNYDASPPGDTIFCEDFCEDDENFERRTLAELFPRRLPGINSGETITANGVAYENVVRIPVAQYASTAFNPLQEAWFSKKHGFVRFRFEQGDWDLLP